MKVIFDTNVYLSAIGFRSKVLQNLILLCLEEMEVYICDELIEEINKNLKLKCDPKKIELEILNSIFELSNKIVLSSHEFYQRDPKDGYLLSLSEAVNADFLITGDKDLLDLQFWKNTQILKPREFVDFLNQKV